MEGHMKQKRKIILALLLLISISFSPITTTVYASQPLPSHITTVLDDTQNDPRAERKVLDQITLLSYSRHYEKELKKVIRNNYNLLSNMEMYKDYSEEEIFVQTDTMIKDFEKTHKNSLVSAANPDLGVTTMSAANPYPGVTYVGYWWGKSTQLRGNSAIHWFIADTEKSINTLTLAGAGLTTALGAYGGVTGVPIGAAVGTLLGSFSSGLTILQLNNALIDVNFVHRTYNNINVDSNMFRCHVYGVTLSGGGGGGVFAVPSIPTAQY